MRRALLPLIALAGLAVFALHKSAAHMFDVDVRCIPRQTTAGSVFPGHPLGQGFRCEFDGLRAIEVALAPLAGRAPVALELALRVGDPRGPVLRRATLAAAELPRADGFARFEFEPVADSSAATFWFELTSSAPSSHALWLRYRAIPDVVRPWGDRVLDAREQQGALLPSPPREGRPDVLLADLCALAFAADGVDAAAGPAKLTLSDADGAVLRTSELAPRAPLANGWAFFAFEPLADSRWRELRYSLELPPGARLVGTAEGHSLIAFHSGGELDTQALGATCRGERLPDRDLVFRAESSRGLRPWLVRLAQRGGARLAFAATCWLAAVAVLVALVRARSDPA